MNVGYHTTYCRRSEYEVFDAEPVRSYNSMRVPAATDSNWGFSGIHNGDSIMEGYGSGYDADDEETVVAVSESGAEDDDQIKIEDEDEDEIIFEDEDEVDIKVEDEEETKIKEEDANNTNTPFSTIPHFNQNSEEDMNEAANNHANPPDIHVELHAIDSSGYWVIWRYWVDGDFFDMVLPADYYS